MNTVMQPPTLPGEVFSIILKIRNLLVQLKDNDIHLVRIGPGPARLHANILLLGLASRVTYWSKSGEYKAHQKLDTLSSIRHLDHLCASVSDALRLLWTDNQIYLEITGGGVFILHQQDNFDDCYIGFMSFEGERKDFGPLQIHNEVLQWIEPVTNKLSSGEEKLLISASTDLSSDVVSAHEKMFNLARRRSLNSAAEKWFLDVALRRRGLSSGSDIQLRALIENNCIILLADSPVTSNIFLGASMF